MPENAEARRIERRPGVWGGLAVVAGTRVPVFMILSRLSNGWTHDEIRGAYPRVSEEDIQASIRYAEDDPAGVAADREAYERALAQHWPASPPYLSASYLRRTTPQPPTKDATMPKNRSAASAAETPAPAAPETPSAEAIPSTSAPCYRCNAPVPFPVGVKLPARRRCPRCATYVLIQQGEEGIVTAACEGG
jgi:uncharacterized protein (DUF433 family)